MKKVFITLGCIIVIIAISALCFLYPYRIPLGCNNIGIEVGCAKVNDMGEIKWSEGELSDTVWMIDNSWELNKFAKLLRSLKLHETSDLPTDMQIVKISFTHSTLQSHETLEKMYVAYDFYTGKLYANKNGKWYLMEANEQLNDHILKRMAGSYWRGQSTYTGGEEFPDSDFENATFRYDLYWTTIPKYEYGANPNVQGSGFKNTKESPINSREEAIALAAKELGYDNPVAVTLYDETCGYYMVELANDNGNGIMRKNGNTIELVEPIFTVVIDDEGRTLDVYEGCTRTRPFWPEL